MSQKIVTLPPAETHLTFSEAVSPSQSAPLEEPGKAAPQPPLPNLAALIFSDLGISLDENTARPAQELFSFTPLDRLGTSNKTCALEDETTEAALKIGVQSSDDMITVKLLERIQATSFSMKTIVLIKKLTRAFWQSHCPLASGETDKMKTFVFTSVLIAAFEIKELSKEELKTATEIDIFKMGEKELYKMAAKITEQVVMRCSELSEKTRNCQKKVFEQFEGEARRRFFASSAEITEIVDLSLASRKAGNCIQALEVAESKDEETGENESDPDCNNISTQTEGLVTDMDISLPLFPAWESEEQRGPPSSERADSGSVEGETEATQK